MKIQKDIRKDIYQNTSQDIINIEPHIVEYQLKTDEFAGQSDADFDMQKTVDDIFEAADTQIAKKTQKLLRVKPQTSKWKNKIGYSIFGFFIFCIAILSIMGYKTYKHLEARWPGIKEAIIYRYEDIQNDLYQIDDNDLTVETYYYKQYFLVLSSEDLINIANSGLTIEQLKQMKDITDNGMTVEVGLFDLLPEGKATKFIKIMLAESQAKELGEIVPVDSITDEDVQQYLETLHEQQKENSGS